MISLYQKTWKEINNEVASNVQKLRKRKKISQKELAKLCGVSAQTIWSVEKGDQEPSEITRIKIELVVGRDGEDGN